MFVKQLCMIAGLQTRGKIIKQRITMGQGERTMVFLLESILKVIIGLIHYTVQIILHLKKLKPRKQIPPATNPLLRQSATQLANKIRKREVKSKEVVQVYIDRLEQIHPILNAIVENRFSAALEEAQKVDDFLSSTTKTEKELEESQPFLGVPCTVKESLAVKGMKHTSGIHSRQHIIAANDAPVVALIRKAGAIPLAVTNTPEMCCWWETYNPLYGRTNNPYNTNHTPGGSSGGESAAIAAAGSVFGLGSDFAGSIRIPASFSGIFGHKPTSMTTPNHDHYPIPANDALKQLLVTGPLTRYATDLKPLLKVMTKGTDCDLNLDVKVDLKSIKIYYLEDVTEMLFASAVQPAIKVAIRKTALHFQGQGNRVEKLVLEKLKYAMFYWYATIKTDDGPQLGLELANRKGFICLLKELLKSAVGASKHTLPIVLFGSLEEGNPVPYKGALHSALLEEYESLKMGLKAILGNNAVLILPTHPTTALRHSEALGRGFDAGYSAVFNVLGFPATSCPVGRDDQGLPIGIQVIANTHQDRLTLAVAEEIERGFGGWTPPY